MNLDIDQAIAELAELCDDYMNGYKPISVRSGLEAGGYDDEEIAVVIARLYGDGFTNCLDHTALSHGVTPPEYPSRAVCFWGPDQLKSRLWSYEAQALRNGSVAG